MFEFGATLARSDFHDFSDWIHRMQKVQTRVNFVDHVKSSQTSTSIWYLLAKIGFDAAENGPLEVRQQFPKT